MEGAGKRFEAVYWPSNEVMQISIDQASALSEKARMPAPKRPESSDRVLL